MTTDWTLTMDCADAPAVAAFRMLALGYVERPPPSGWDSWDAWMAAQGVPEEERAAPSPGSLPGRPDWTMSRCATRRATSSASSERGVREGHVGGACERGA